MDPRRQRLLLRKWKGPAAQAAADPDLVISGLSPQYWYDMQQVAGSDGDSISSVSDRSGNGYDLTAGTAPVLKKSLSPFGGKNALRFDGSAGLANTTWPASGAGAFTVFLVFKASSLTTATHGLLALGKPAVTSAQVYVVGLASFNAAGLVITNAAANLYSMDAPAMDSSKAYVLALRCTDGTNNNVWVDGVARTPSTYSWVHSVVTNGIDVGLWTAGGTAFLGDLAEIAHFNSSLSDANVAAVNTALLSKYTISP